jgi:hypothetical protein
MAPPPMGGIEGGEDEEQAAVWRVRMEELKGALAACDDGTKVCRGVGVWGLGWFIRSFVCLNDWSVGWGDDGSRSMDGWIGRSILILIDPTLHPPTHTSQPTHPKLSTTQHSTIDHYTHTYIPTHPSQTQHSTQHN